jgi:hypothetical protein
VFAINLNLMAAVLAGLMMTIPLAAQTQQGDILGTERDPQSAGVPNAEIKITNQTTGAVRSLSASEVGDYLALGFYPGAYRVEVTRVGVQKVVVESVRVEPQARVRLDIPLRAAKWPQRSRSMPDSSRPKAPLSTLPFGRWRILSRRRRKNYRDDPERSRPGSRPPAAGCLRRRP